MNKEDLITRAEITREEAKKNGKIFHCGSNAAKNARLAELARVQGRRNSGNTK
jgi:hypothetical protein